MLRKFLLTLAVIFGVVSVSATLIAFSENQHWLIRICDFPRLQIILLLFFSILVFSYYELRRKKMNYMIISALSIFLIFQTYKIWPYTAMSSFQVMPYTKPDTDNHLSIVYSNVYMTNRNWKAALREMTRYDPDMILAVETDQWWAEKLRVLAEYYPYSAELPLNNTYGMTLYSKLPISDTKFKFLVEKEVPSIEPIVTLPSGQRVKCFFIHPKPPTPDEAGSSKQRDKELILIAKKAKATNLPVIVAGDLNDVGWSFTSRLFQEISGLLDPRVGRGLYATFNANLPFLRWPLDHVFTSREFRVIELERLSHMGSDHFPIYFKLSFEPEGMEMNKKISPPKKDIEKANKKLLK